MSPRISRGMALALCLCAELLASSGITGVVLDPAGAPIADARLELSNGGQTLLRATATESAGGFDLADVAPGSYTLRVRAKAFGERALPVRVTDGVSPVLRIVLSEIAPEYTSITVTASRGSVEDAETAPQVVRSVARDELGYRLLQTPAHGLEGTPGILIQETTYGQSSPFLRGLTGYQTLLLVDGIRFNTSTFRSGPNQYFSLLLPSQIDHLEGVLGPTGATFGSDAMGGTINALTAPVRSGNEGGRYFPHGELSWFGSSADLSTGWHARITGGGPRLAWLAGGTQQHNNDLRSGGALDSRNAFRRYFDLDPAQISSLTGGRLRDTASARMGGMAKAAWRIAPGQSLTLWSSFSELRGVRSYRELLGGQGRLISNIAPQALNFAYARYEKQGLGPLDNLTGTFSINSQRDGAVQQALKYTDTITTNHNRVDVFGYSVQATAHVGAHQALVFGSDTFAERVFASRTNFNPVQRTTAQERAQYPNDSRYTTASAFVQDTASLASGRVRLTGGLRYTHVGFAAWANRNRDAAGNLLGVADTHRTFSDLTFNTSASWQIKPKFAWHVLFGRGFRAPNLNDLGSTGLTTLGYDVPTEEVVTLKGLYAIDSSDTGAASGNPVRTLNAESLYNYETGWSFRTERIYLRAQVFDAELKDPISGRTVLFPAGSVPATIAGVAVFPLTPSPAQQQQGVVAVGTSFGPRAVKTEVNDGTTKYYGTEWSLRLALAPRWALETAYSFMAGRDLNPNRPARRLPPQQGTAVLRYTPLRGGLWLEVAARAAGAQNRLNGGDIDDDRIGASRRRSDIAGFFTGGVVSPYLSAGADGRIGTADDIFVPTGETALQIQNRVLPLGQVVNGVLVAGSGTRVPLFLRGGGWFALDVRGGKRIAGNLHMIFAVSNLLDRNYRVYGSGIDSPGINVFAGLKHSF